MDFLEEEKPCEIQSKVEVHGTGPSLENCQSENSVHLCYTMIHKSLQSDCILSCWNDGTYTDLVFPQHVCDGQVCDLSGSSRLILHETV